MLLSDILSYHGYYHSRGSATTYERKVKANPVIVITAIVLDVVVLLGFIWVRAQTNLTVIIVSGALIAFAFFGEKIFLGLANKKEKGKEKHHHED